MPSPSLFCAASLCLAALGPVCAGQDSAERRAPSSRLVEGTPMYDLLPLDGIPAIDDPVHVDAEAADDFLQPDEPVLGFIGPDGTPMAWSAWQLETHEIVNDVIDGMPVAATW
jgi:hypothetical protein